MGRIVVTEFVSPDGVKEDPGGSEGRWNNSTVLRGEVMAEIRAPEQRLEGDPLVAGSATLSQTLGDVSELRTSALDAVKAVGGDCHPELPLRRIHR